MITELDFEFKHAQINENGVVEGLSYATEIIMGRPELIYISKEHPLYEQITFGWRYINGDWFEPLQPTQEAKYQQELADIDAQLNTIYAKEKYNEWLYENGVAQTIQPTTYGISEKQRLLIRMKELLNILNNL